MSLGSRPTFLPNGILIHPAIWPQQIWTEIGGCAPLGRGAESPSNTMWPGPTPTRMPSFILIRKTLWSQYTNVTGRQDRTGKTAVRQHRPNRFNVNFSRHVTCISYPAVHESLLGSKWRRQTDIVNLLKTSTVISQPKFCKSSENHHSNNNNNNNKPICNAPDASVTDPEAPRTLRNITVRVDH